MNLGSLLGLHLMVGLGVAFAVYLRLPPQPMLQRVFVLATAAIFWPLYLPVLLSMATTGDAVDGKTEPAPAKDNLAQAIAQADAELEAALHSLDGWAEHVLAREKGRLHELRQAWLAQAERIRDMDRVLSRPEYAGPSDEPPPINFAGERQRSSQQMIRQNLDRLKIVRQRTLDDLLGTLAWVRELASMIHLAKFTGAPASRAEELVAQIAAAVEGLSALTWEEEASSEHWRVAEVKARPVELP